MLGLESTSSRMMSIGKAMLLNKNVKTTEEILQQIDNVDKETIKTEENNTKENGIINKKNYFNLIIFIKYCY